MSDQVSTQRVRGWVWALAGAALTLVVVAIAAVVLGVLRSAEPTASAPLPEPWPSETTTQAPVATRDATAQASPAPVSGFVTAEATAREDSADPDMVTPYLRDLPSHYFVREPDFEERGVAKIAGTEYAQSYFFDSLCARDCQEVVEFNVPDAFSSFEGTFGLTDNSRQDDKIDGVVFISAYAVGGEEVFPAERIAFPAQRDFTIDVSDVSRLTFVVAGQDLHEEVCFCDARFVE